MQTNEVVAQGVGTFGTGKVGMYHEIRDDPSDEHIRTLNKHNLHQFDPEYLAMKKIAQITNLYVRRCRFISKSVMFLQFVCSATFEELESIFKNG